MACFQLFSKEEIHLEEQASALEQMKSLTYKSNFFRFSTFKIWGSIKGFHIRFLVTFITSTFNISSFCIALYLSISFLENLQIESGNKTVLRIYGLFQIQAISQLSFFYSLRSMGFMRQFTRWNRTRYPIWANMYDRDTLTYSRNCRWSNV